MKLKNNSMRIFNGGRDASTMDWENQRLMVEINNKHLETLKSEYIDGLKEQIEMYKKLNALNEQIIQTKDEYIEILEVQIASLTLNK